MDLKRINEALNTYVRPQTFPLALKLCQSETDLPEKARMPVRDMGYPVALCQAIGLSRRFGWTMAVGKEDQCCYGGAATMGFLAKPPQGDDSPFAAEKQLETGKYGYLLTAALERADFEPDVVLLYGNSAQVMRLTQSASRLPGGSVNAIASGFGDCGDIVARSMHSNECQVILPSGGDRIFGSTQDHEMIFTMPGGKAEEIAGALGDTHKAGFRYPVLTDLRHPPELPPFLKIPDNS
ncbi:MAG: DUF169 domain-containing protein [Deltaproteobacteria bacterium]|nr:DUF169 domain-containing protein [Deltaproteobacteria bacterium]MBW2053776.1 DUF169 domain-containing protein [Deltaproteobacteria bacterium]MBW2142497.1 DUF169 domain-containing protein [Deltaproteobacteria bacterium]